MKQWYVLQVMTGTESDCQRSAAAAGLRTLVPTRIMPELSQGKWREREHTMLPGYVFLLSDGSAADYYRMSAIPGAIRLLPGGGECSPVPKEQMDWIMELSNSGRPWTISTAAMIEGKLKVLQGPLIGREHMIQSWDRRRRRARIEIRVLDERRVIEVGLAEDTKEK